MLSLSQTEKWGSNNRGHLSAEVRAPKNVLQESMKDGKGSNLLLNKGIMQHLEQPDSRATGGKHVKQSDLQNTAAQPCHPRFVLPTANQFQSKSELEG